MRCHGQIKRWKLALDRFEHIVETYEEPGIDNELVPLGEGHVRPQLLRPRSCICLMYESGKTIFVYL